LEVPDVRHLHPLLAGDDRLEIDVGAVRLEHAFGARLGVINLLHGKAAPRQFDAFRLARSQRLQTELRGTAGTQAFIKVGKGGGKVVRLDQLPPYRGKRTPKSHGEQST